MGRRRVRSWVVAATILIALALGASRVSQHLSEPAPTDSLATATPTPSAAHGTNDSLPRARPPAIRTNVPRFAPPAVWSAKDAGIARHPRRLAPNTEPLEDKRPLPRVGSRELAAALEQRLDAAKAAAERCLDAFPEPDDALTSGVMLAITLDTGGVDEVWLEGRAGVPTGPLACISSSIYPVDWSGLTPDPIKVTVKLRYEGEDSGA